MKKTLFLLALLWTGSGLTALAAGYGGAFDNATNAESYGRTPKEYVPYDKFAKPYKQFFLEPLEYSGWGRNLPEPDRVDRVKIGFLGPIMATVSVATGGASHEEVLGKKMLQGAQLAIEHANAAKGYRGTGVPFELVVRNDNGLWGSSGNEIIQLAYNDHVWAILGTIDGANTHIAIRVALKIEIPVLTTGDTDPTYIETGIPWAFRNITDDRQMCYLLADYVFKKLKLTRVAALRSNNRYGRISISEFRESATRLGHPFLVEMNYQVGDTNFSAQLQRIQALNPEAVMTYGNARESALVLKQMRAMGMTALFLGSDRMVSKEFLDLVGSPAGPVVAGYPYNPSSRDPKCLKFVKDFTERYGDPPETYAAHAYDGIMMLVEAINKSGLNRARIRDALATMKTFPGVTGAKEFDAVSGNVSPACLAVLEGDRFVFRTREEWFGP